MPDDPVIRLDAGVEAVRAYVAAQAARSRDHVLTRPGPILEAVVARGAAVEVVGEPFDVGDGDAGVLRSELLQRGWRSGGSGPGGGRRTDGPDAPGSGG